MIKAIIFDFDGTIIDTETAWYLAFKGAYDSHGVDFPLERYAECLGTSLQSFNPYTYIRTHYKIPVDLNEFRKSIENKHTEMMEKEAIRPGILPLLQSAKEANLKIGLASSSSREWIDKYIQLLDIGEYFECYCTSDTVQNVKPDPELYLQALEKLNVKANEAIAIEDSPNGARAAVAAGIPTVVIKNTISEQLPFSTGHHTIDSLENHNLKDLIDLFR